MPPHQLYSSPYLCSALADVFLTLAHAHRPPERICEIPTTYEYDMLLANIAKSHQTKKQQIIPSGPSLSRPSSIQGPNKTRTFLALSAQSPKGYLQRRLSYRKCLHGRNVLASLLHHLFSFGRISIPEPIHRFRQIF